MMMSLDNEWQNYIIPAPTIVSLMGQLVLIASGKDFSLRRGKPQGGFKRIKQPRSFGATMLQVSQEAGNAFATAQTNMKVVLELMRSVSKPLKTVRDLLKLKNPKAIQMQLEAQLELIERKSLKARDLVLNVSTTFDDVTALITEVILTVAKSKKMYSDDIKAMEKRLTNLASSKDNLKFKKDELDQRDERLREKLKEAGDSYDKALKKIPSTWTKIGQQALGDLVKIGTAVGTMVATGGSSALMKMGMKIKDTAMNALGTAEDMGLGALIPGLGGVLGGLGGATQDCDPDYDYEEGSSQCSGMPTDSDLEQQALDAQDAKIQAATFCTIAKQVKNLITELKSRSEILFQKIHNSEASESRGSDDNAHEENEGTSEENEEDDNYDESNDVTEDRRPDRRDDEEYDDDDDFSEPRKDRKPAHQSPRNQEEYNDRESNQDADYDYEDSDNTRTENADDYEYPSKPNYRSQSQGQRSHRDSDRQYRSYEDDRRPRSHHRPNNHDSRSSDDYDYDNYDNNGRRYRSKRSAETNQTQPRVTFDDLATFFRDMPSDHLNALAEQLPEDNPATENLLSYIEKAKGIAKNLYDMAESQEASEDKMMSIQEEMNATSSALEPYATAGVLMRGGPSALDSATDLGVKSETDRQKAEAQMKLHALQQAQNEEENGFLQKLKIMEKLGDVEAKIAALDFKKGEYNQFLQVMKEGTMILSSLKNEWMKMATFFSRISNYVNQTFTQSVGKMTKSARELYKEDQKSKSGTYMNDILADDFRNIRESAFFVAVLSFTYVKISDKFIMPPLGKLSAAVAIPNDKKKHYILKLQAGANEATLKIREYALKVKDKANQKLRAYRQKLEAIASNGIQPINTDLIMQAEGSKLLAISCFRKPLSKEMRDKCSHGIGDLSALQEIGRAVEQAAN